MTRAGRTLAMAMLLAAVGACRNADVMTASYATIEEARQAGAIERGWVPAWLPPNAHDLREAHDVDTNRRWGLFNFPPSDADALRRTLRPGEISLDGVRCALPRRIEWWPVLLRGELDTGRIRATGVEAYRARDADLIVAVNWKQGRAYYWPAE